MQHTLTAVGDITFGDCPDSFGFGVRSTLGRLNQKDIAERVRDLLGEADCHFANLESVMSDQGVRPFVLGTREMRGSPRDLEFISACGWNVVNVANNHFFQHGISAVRDTAERLVQRGIVPVGLAAGGKVSLEDVRLPSFNLQVVAASMRPEQYRPDEIVPYALDLTGMEILASVESSRRSKIGLPLICSLHWGHELMETPSREQQDLARALVDAGASLVLGHHPHVLQGVEEYRGGLIAYSLGNFIFDMMYGSSSETAVLRVKFDRERVESYELVPAMVSTDCFPRRPRADEKRRIMNRVTRLSSTLRDGELPSDAELKVEQKRTYTTFRRSAYRQFFRDWHRFPPYFFCYAIVRALLRRLGLAHNP